MYVLVYLAALFCVGSSQTLPDIQTQIHNLVTGLDECIELGFLCKVQINRTTCTPECINKTQVCDGKKDCSNAIDELVCTTRCPNGILCRDRLNCATKCDGDPECAGGEDEAGCPTICPDGELLCNDMTTCATPCDTNTMCPGGENIWNCGAECTGDDVLCRDLMTCATKCDGNRECTTDEDEACPFQCLCRQKQYICTGDSERCIDRSQFCNEVQDECPNGEDEKDGMCA